MTSGEVMPNLFDASCCNVDVVNGAGACDLAMLFLISETMYGLPSSSARTASFSSAFLGLYFLPAFSERSALKGEYSLGLSCNSAVRFQYSSGTKA